MAFFWGESTEMHDNWDKEAAANKFLSLSMLSCNPNLHLLLLICDCWGPGLCINYSLFARSAPGPEDIGNYSLCQRSRWTPVDKETCWWGHRAQNPPHKTLSLSFIKPPDPSFLRPPFCPPSPPTLAPTSFTPGCQGVRGRSRVSVLFSPLSGMPS